jgi:hypothetical protein
MDRSFLILSRQSNPPVGCQACTRMSEESQSRRRGLGTAQSRNATYALCILVLPSAVHPLVHRRCAYFDFIAVGVAVSSQKKVITSYSNCPNPCFSWLFNILWVALERQRVQCICILQRRWDQIQSLSEMPHLLRNHQRWLPWQQLLEVLLHECIYILVICPVHVIAIRNLIQYPNVYVSLFDLGLSFG